MIKPSRQVDLLAEIVVDSVAGMFPPDQAAVILFDPRLPLDQSVLFSTADAADLIPVLRALLARLESGSLRMPMEAGVRWVDVEKEG